jgi:hypothetical protein
MKHFILAIFLLCCTEIPATAQATAKSATPAKYEWHKSEDGRRYYIFDVQAKSYIIGSDGYLVVVDATRSTLPDFIDSYAIYPNRELSAAPPLPDVVAIKSGEGPPADATVKVPAQIPLPTTLIEKIPTKETETPPAYVPPAQSFRSRTVRNNAATHATHATRDPSYNQNIR